MNLYLVALLPPEPVRQQVWEMKQEVHQRTGSRNAVKLPPHITLIPPTRQSADFQAECISALQAFAATQTPFMVGLQDFAWFGSRTLFVHVSEDAALQQFHAALVTWCGQYLPAVPREARPFTAHMTLATRDLPAAQVPELKLDFATRRYTATFPVHSFELFRHDGQKWVSVAEFPLAAVGAGAAKQM